MDMLLFMIFDVGNTGDVGGASCSLSDALMNAAIMGFGMFLAVLVMW